MKKHCVVHYKINKAETKTVAVHGPYTKAEAEAFIWSHADITGKDGTRDTYRRADFVSTYKDKNR